MTVQLTSRLDGVIGARTANAMKRAFDIETVGDLLAHVPRRYLDRGQLSDLSALVIGEKATVLADVYDVQSTRMRQRKGSILRVRITDGRGFATVTFFNQPWRANELKAGARAMFSGKVASFGDVLQLENPDYELLPANPEIGALEADTIEAQEWANRPIPVYPASARVASWVIARSTSQVLDVLEDVADPLPDETRARVNIIGYREMFEGLHRPISAEKWRLARRSLLFREAFDLQLSLLKRRLEAGQAKGVARPVQSGGLLDSLDAELPFALTADQRSVGAEISADLSKPHPMHRLLQGEVGSGKTLVALRAMLQVADTRGQSALLAPTEVLATQHFRSVLQTLSPELVATLHPVLLTAKMPTAQRKKSLLAIASGQARIVVGTHALLSENVTFADLGLAVIDEQHRFGVEQRELLRAKGVEPHVLAMTATPIPRTVALTAFGDLEVSTIRELPPGRQGIQTNAVSEHDGGRQSSRVWPRAAEEVAAGRQVYVVCPAIRSQVGGEFEFEAGDEPHELEAFGSEDPVNESRPLANVEDTLAQLRSLSMFEGANIASLTGAMPAEESERVMAAFQDGAIDVLVATTVIEVGVNVPNATMMVIRDADRFGISQLHQLRGRVGRGEHPGLCILMTAVDPASLAGERLKAVAATNDGFQLAETDLELRREGDVLGRTQSGGKSTLRVLRVARHKNTLQAARDAATELLERDPQLVSAPLLQARLQEEQERLENLAKS